MIKNKEEKYIIIFAAIILTTWMIINLEKENTQIKNIKNLKEKIKAKKIISTKKKTKIPNIEVEITGAVKSPGVYNIKQGSRFFQLIEQAGGFKKNADKEKYSKNYLLKDGQSYFIKYKN